MSKSSNPIRGTLLRWSSALLGIAAAFMIPFDDAKTARGFIALVICAVTAVSQYVAYRNAQEHKAELAALKTEVDAGAIRVEAVAAVAQATDTKADAAIRGRRLSPDQMDAIAAHLAGVDLSGVRLSISFIAAATGAQDFAESVAQFLPKFRIHPPWPFARNPLAGPQPQPRINDTLFIVLSNPPAAVEQLVAAFGSAVPEIHRSGEGSFGYVSTNNQMMIIVGHKT